MARGKVEALVGCQSSATSGSAQDGYPCPLRLSLQILLAEDDRDLGQAIAAGLGREGLRVDWVRDGIDAHCAFLRGGHSALVLDLGLPGLGGLDLLHRVRQSDPQLPVLIITARVGVRDRVLGLDFGADDYLCKPFDLAELLARVRAMTRRVRAPNGVVLVSGGVEVDLGCHRVSRDGQAIWLTAREYSVLRLLLGSVGRTVSRLEIEEHLGTWGDSVEGNLVEVYVYNLRKKLGRDFILTYRGSGYRVSHSG